MNRVSAVLFDLGNVLVRIHPEAFAASLGLQSRQTQSEHHSRVIDLTRRYEWGALSTDEFFAALGELFEGKFLRSRLEDAMASVIGMPIPGMQQLLQAVHSSAATTALVSNTNEFHIRWCLKQFPFLKFPVRRYLSYELQSLKPDPQYYRRVLQDLGLPAAGVLFVDDLPENVQGAQNAGMMGHLFNSAKALSEEFRTLGVLA